MSKGPSEEALATARAEAQEWDDGRRAVVLTGSHARGDADPESDLDIRIVGEGPSKRLLKRRGDFLISISAQTEDEHRDAMTDPSECTEVVPGWRSAIVLVDPNGAAARIKSEAESWDWSELDSDAVDEWVAEQLTSLAEEIHTLVGNLNQDIRPAAAATFSGIATDLAPVMTVRRRLLYSSEKELWDVVADEMGGRWGELQSTALGDGTFDEAVDAAMDLFILAVDDSNDLFDARQRDVVEHARSLAVKHVGGRS